MENYKISFFGYFILLFTSLSITFSLTVILFFISVILIHEALIFLNILISSIVTVLLIELYTTICPLKVRVLSADNAFVFYSLLRKFKIPIYELDVDKKRGFYSQSYIIKYKSNLRTKKKYLNNFLFRGIDKLFERIQ